MCSISILAGIVVGRMEYQAEKEAAEGSPDDVSAGQGAEARRPAPPAKPERASRPSRSRRREEESSPAFESPAAEKKDSSTPPAGSRPDATAAKDPSAYRERLESLQALILKQDFRSAEKGARDLEAETLRGPAAVHVEALKLAAKARIFQRLISSMPARPAQAGGAKVGRGAEALLSNGSKISGALLGERADRYIFKLASGGIFCPAREDVLEVRPVESETAPTTDWKTMQPKVSKLAHPIDIFIDGVERCYRLGLKREGLELLEQLLARPDSDNIPLLFAQDADESSLSDWRLAAGRDVPSVASARDVPKGSASDDAPSDDASGDSPSGDTIVKPKIFGLDDDPGAPPPTAGIARRAPESTPPSAEITPPGPRAPQAPPAPVDPATLVKAAQLLGEAQALYQGAAGEEGREKDFQSARERLQRVLDILEPLPPGNEEIKKLRRRVAQLLSDVSRASPF
jgi:hypothetical protein